MIGIVVVSHSPKLAEAAVELALQMVAGPPPPIRIAAGAGGALGTDASAVAAAIDDVASASGVLVVPDLGSAVLSAELAVELASIAVEVVVTDGPFVEGLTAGMVLAAGGATLAEVAREVSGALAGKRAHLAEPAHPVPPPLDTAVAEVTLTDPAGLHARPAAALVAAARTFDARVEVRDLTTGRGPVAVGSLVALLALGAGHGHRLRLGASGSDAAAAVTALADLMADGSGETPSARAESPPVRPLARHTIGRRTATSGPPHPLNDRTC